MKSAPNKRILVFNVNWIGDAVLSTAVIRNLRYNFPSGFIACVIPPRCLPVLHGNRYLYEIIVFDEKGRHAGFLGWLAFCMELRKKHFDAVYLLHRSMSRALLAAAAGIPERIGYYTRKRGWLLTKRLASPDIFSTHRAEYYLDVLRQSGLMVRDSHADFSVPQEQEESAAALLASFCRPGDFCVAINPGGNWLPKRWPQDNYAALVRRLADEFHAKIIITGGAEDTALAAAIEQKSGVKVLSLCGQCGLKEFAAVVRRLAVFITADSGPLHIAAAAGAKRIIALFGPTDPELTAPLQNANTIILRKPSGCRIPCYVVDCADNKCMHAITVDDVLAQVRSIHAAN
jgi:heptosyltransferase II